MPSKIILKKSSVAAKAPVAGDLDFGELAINYTDSKLYFKKADGSIDAFSSAAAAAPVTSVGGFTGAVTAANLLDAIKTVDGTGSGLDADTLDGLSSASFYLASNPSGYTTNTGTVTSVGATAPVVSSGGTAPTISMAAATATINGYMTSAYASKLDGIAAGAQVNVATNLAQGTRTTTAVPITSSTGTTATLDIATTLLAGVMSSADKTKLDGIATGATANTGTVTSVGGTGTVSGLTLTGTVTTSGNLTLGGALSVTPSNFSAQNASTFLASPLGSAGSVSFRSIVAGDVPTLNQNTTGTAANVTGTVAIANGGTGATTAAAARTNLGATTLGGNLYTLTNVAAIAFPRFNADNTVSSLDAATFRTAIGAGTSSTTGTVTSVGGTGTVSGLTLTGTVTTTGNLTLGGTLAVTASNFASQTANTILAAPNGTAGVPTFRAIVAADIPTLNQSTTGNAATATNISNTGTVTLATATESNSIYVTAPSYSTDTPVKLMNFDWYSNIFSIGNIRSGGAASSGFGVYYTASGGSRIEIARFGTGGAFNTIGAITQNGSQVLTAGNYNSYSPTLTGGGASGSWGINITGNAATATTAANLSGLTITNSSSAINPDNVTQNQLGYNTNVSLFGQTDGGLYSSAYSSSWIHQIYGDFRSGQIAIRGKNSGTWQAWRTVLDSGNYTSYSPSLTGSGASGTWGISVTGNAATAGGFAPSQTSGALSRIVVADANGYILNSYFNSTDNAVASGVSAVMVKAGDNYYRSGTAAAVATFISGQTMNISGSSTSCTGTAANVTGTVAIANGGTGQTTATAAFNALAPTQATNSGKYLTTNGTTTSWATVVAGASLANDVATTTNLYPLFSAATTGTPTTIYTSDAQYLYKPSTGELSVKVPRASNGIVVNSATISANYTIATGDNGLSAGPITISSGFAVTVASGAIWVIV